MVAALTTESASTTWPPGSTGGDNLQEGEFAWAIGGRLVFVLDAARTIRTWDASLGGLQATATANPQRAPGAGVRDASQVTAVFSPDRSRLALTWRDRNLGILRDVRTGELLGPPFRQTAVEHVVFSADGRYLATATYQGRHTPIVVLRDGRTGKAIRKPWVSAKLIHALAFSPDGKTLAVGGVGGTAVLDVPTLTLRWALPEATCINGLLFHPDSRRLAVRAAYGWPGVGAGLRVWDVTAGKPLAPFRSVPDAYSPQLAWEKGELVAYIGGRTRPAATVGRRQGGSRRAWRLGQVRGISFSADSARMVASSSAVNVRQWDTRTGKPVGVAVITTSLTGTSLYTSDNKVLAVKSGGNSVALWDAETGWPLGPPLVHGSVPLVTALTDQDRTLLTVTKAGGVRAWPMPRPVMDDPDRFEAWLHARGGRRVAGEEMVQLTLEEWTAACATLKKRWPQADPTLVEPPDDPIAWHQQRAQDAEEVGNERGELYHLTQWAALRLRELAVHARIARLHARVAGRLPAGLGRDREWELARAAAKRGQGRPGEDDWDRLCAMEAASRKSPDESLWYLDRLIGRNGRDPTLLADRAAIYHQRGDKQKRDADLRQALAAGRNQGPRLCAEDSRGMGPRGSLGRDDADAGGCVEERFREPASGACWP